jgi:chromosome segregation ATPase
MRYTTNEKRRKGVTKGVYCNIEKLMKLAGKFDTEQEFAETIGRSNTWLYNAKKSGTMSMTDALAIKCVHGVDVIIEKEEEEEIKEEKKEKNSDLTAKLDEINANIKELTTTVSRLGNVNMQILEEFHKLNKELLNTKN